MCSIRLKYEIWPGGPEFETDSRGLSPKVTGLHLVGVGGDTLGNTLALPASYARARTADPRTLHSIRLKYEILPGGSKFDTDSRGLNPTATGLHLVGVRGDTPGNTLAVPASRADVEGSNGEPQNFVFYSIKIRKLVRGSHV